MFAKRQAQKQPPEMFCEKRCEGLKSCNFIEKRLQHRFFPVKFEKILRTLFLKNICEQLLLEAAISILWTEATIHMCSTYLKKNWKFPWKQQLKTLLLVTVQTLSLSFRVYFVLKNPQISRVSSLIKLQTGGLQLYLKRYPCAVISC